MIRYGNVGSPKTWMVQAPNYLSVQNTPSIAACASLFSGVAACYLYSAIARAYQRIAEICSDRSWTSDGHHVNHSGHQVQGLYGVPCVPSESLSLKRLGEVNA